MTKQSKKHPFEVLSQLNLNDKVKVKPNASKAKYISWSDAWDSVKRAYPDAHFSVKTFFSGNDNGVDMPYLATPLGVMVGTIVTIDGHRQECYMPVLDSTNNALKDEAYVIKGKYGDRTVKACTMFDVNTSIMRCLVKNLAMFGLGLYIYTDDTMPEAIEQAPAKNQVRPVITPDHELYPQVEAYVKNNAKKREWQLIMKQLKTKYSLSSDILNQLTKVYEQSK